MILTWRFPARHGGTPVHHPVILFCLGLTENLGNGNSPITLDPQLVGFATQGTFEMGAVHHPIS